MKRTVTFLLMCGLGVGLGSVIASCGGDDDETGGVSNNKKISDISEEEAYSLCVAFCNDVQIPALELGCTVTAVGLSLGNANLCDKAYDTCMDSDLAPVSCEESCTADDSGTDDGEPDTEEAPECDATVGEVSACFNAYAAMVADISEQLSCDTKVSELEGILAPLGETPSACAALEQKCPEMVPDVNSSEM